MFSITDILLRAKKNVHISDLLVLLGMTVGYLATRLMNLKALPIFSDEGIYIHWAKIAGNDPEWRFISLIDGKQPLQTWGTAILLKLVPQDFLIAGRLFAVATGFVALIGIILLCTYLWGRRAGIIAGILYIVTPFFLFYDRLALVDSGVNAACIWILFASIVLVRKMRLDVALIYGFIAGVGLLAKSTVAMFVGLSAFALIQLFPVDPHKVVRGTPWRKVIDFLFLWFVGATVAFAIYSIQRISPFYHMVGQKNLTFILSPTEFIHNPFALVAGNIQAVPLYIGWELGWIPLVLGIVGLVYLIRRDWRLGIYIALWIVLPLIVIVHFNKVLYPRYLIFFASLFTILTVYFFTQFKRKIILIGTIVILSLLSLPIIFDVTRISLPPIDAGQYVHGTTAVWGAEEAVQVIREASTPQKPALILAEGNFGLVADVLDVYKRDGDTFEIRGLWPLSDDEIYKATAEAKMRPVFIIFSHRNTFSLDLPMQLIKKYEKPHGSPDALYLFKFSDRKLGENQ